MSTNYTNYPGILKSNRADKTLAFAEDIAFDATNLGDENNSVKAKIESLQRQVDELTNLLRLTLK